MDTTQLQDVVLEAMRTDDENVRLLPFPVSESLAEKLNDQRERLDNVPLTASGKDRYHEARQTYGCFAAIAKGAKDRELKEDRIFIPRTEIRNGNGCARIPSLKARLTVPADVHVKGITFIRENGVWTGQLEVKQAA